MGESLILSSAFPMRRLLFILAPLFFLAACAGEQEGVRVEEPADHRALKATLDQMTGALEAENVFAFAEHVSERYVPSRFGLKSDMDQEMAEYLGHSYRVIINRLNVDEDVGTIVGEWRHVRSHRESGEQEMLAGATELRFRKERGRWFLEQQNGDPLFGR